MYKIVKKKEAVPHINQIEILAPEIAKKSLPGHFIMFKIDEEGERVPLNISSVNTKKGTITVFCHVVGKTTHQLASLKDGDMIQDVLGPLGTPAEVKKFGTVLCIGGDVLTPSLHFTIEALREHGNKIIGVIGARSENQLLYETEMRNVCDDLYISTDDGTRGYKGLSFLHDVLKKKQIDLVVAMGPVILMKTISKLTLPYNIPTKVYLIPPMVDGMGMCGACRVTVGDEILYACVDGPFFDGHKVDFDELMTRLKSFTPHEKISYVFYKERGDNQ